MILCPPVSSDPRGQRTHVNVRMALCPEPAAVVCEPPAIAERLPLPDADEPQSKGGAWPLADEARGSGNRLLTRAALNLVPEFPATFDTNFMM